MDRAKLRGMPLRVISVTVISVLLVLGPVGSAQADTARVRGIFVSSFVWRPKTRSIVEGDTIRWKSVEGNHDVRRVVRIGATSSRYPRAPP